MKLPQFPSIKFTFVFFLFVFLTVSIITADFYDPTFFHQLYPIGGIKNRFGILGALLGGSSIEILGPACILVPWFILKIAFSSNKRFRLSYYSLLMITSISIAYSLWIPSSFQELSVTTFLLHDGYLGTLGALWLNENLTPLISNISISLILVYCLIKIYNELPIMIIFYGALNSGIILPIYIVKQVCEKIILYINAGVNFIATQYKIFNRPVLLPPNQAEEPTIILPEEEKTGEKTS